MTPEMYRKLQLKFGKVAFDLKTQRRMTPAQLGEAMRDFEGKLTSRAVATEALVPLDELRRRAESRLAKMRRGR